ncbi:glycosyltransferase family 2 protein [Candidatus Nanosynbacter sp. TM7-075]|uniref:glycosyltransferase family 2 protein n=1 Tax=unclassified Candidatus Nanosynbacter TaxID=2725944 RepID=UPI001FB61582|nr:MULTISPECIES: glycosyltransferase family 2 protein [unclassified Candidatus Nanosynbacter]MCJ1967283.1 glycosyltransferase family 2 protein [Candidatus Nanosynbacter sp. TM7-075]MCJ1967854.1 glycosyltransferase family 2 protein [Candidatus Nanosynbacter sp. TM7-076]
MYRKLETAVVIPCYNEEKMITQTIKKIPEYIDHIIAVNDASTDNTIGVLNKLKKQYSKLIIVDNKVNQGVGGALIAGYDYAIKNTKATAIGIVAGDDQFDSSYLKAMLDDFIDQSADYVKASRFFHREAFKTMPKYRQFGNIFISLLTKFSTGYYSITDITNGCGWLRREIIEKIDFSIVEKRYDYETSMLTALSIANAKVIDHAVPAHYGDEKSTIKLIPTAWRNLKAVWKGFWRRIYYKYVLYGFHPVALFLFTGMFFLIISLLLAIFLLYVKLFAHQSPTAGSVMLAVLPFILGIQLTLTALTIDVSNENNNFKK